MRVAVAVLSIGLLRRQLVLEGQVVVETVVKGQLLGMDRMDWVVEVEGVPLQQPFIILAAKVEMV